MAVTECKGGLSLTRIPGQEIYICDARGDVETIIRVLSVSGDRVRLNVNAPRNLKSPPQRGLRGDTEKGSN